MPRKKAQRGDVPDGADNPLDAAVQRRDESVLDAVNRAVNAGEVLLAFQPIMQARDPEKVAFYEGLVRVLDATGRVIPAVQFMNVAEQSELGRKLDCQALRLGLRALKAHPQLRMSVNMSGRSIGYKPWRQILNRFMRQDVTLGERLILEISESSAMTLPEIVAEFIAEHQNRGISFALDDFGSGLMAVKYLRDFCFDAVKMDGQFTKDIHNQADNQVIANALIAVAREFDMFTVASRVEDPNEAAQLIGMGADCLQGYLFGAPSVHPPWIPQARSRMTG